MIEKPAKAGNDGKSKAQSAPSLLRATELMELVEDTDVLVLRNAGAAVAHVDSQLTTTPAAADDQSATRRIIHRVGRQIQENPLKQDGIAA